MYALKHRLGFLALTWPETIARARTVSCVDDSFRVFLTNGDVGVTSGQGELSEAFLQRLPPLVEAAHAKAMLRRRRQLMSSLQGELSRFGIGHRLISDWSIIAEPGSFRKGDSKVLSITPRPPEVPDLFVLDGHCRGHAGTPVPKGVLIHTVGRLSEERERLFTWVTENRALTLADEDQIVQLVEGIAAEAKAP
jgi:hypothetical protein